MQRFELSDEQWVRGGGFFLREKGDSGRPSEDNRLFIEAVLWIARAGAPWRNFPERFGLWNTGFTRSNRWSLKGVWRRGFEALQDLDLE